MKEWTTLEDMFQKYPYKKRQIEGKKVFQPYIKKKDAVEDHKYSVTFREFSDILKFFVWEIVEDLLHGKRITLPYRLGTMHFVKMRRINKSVGARKRYRNLHTQGYHPRFVWGRIKIKYKKFYSFNLSRGVWLRVSRQLKETPFLIHNIREQ